MVYGAAERLYRAACVSSGWDPGGTESRGKFLETVMGEPR